MTIAYIRPTSTLSYQLHKYPNTGSNHEKVNEASSDSDTSYVYDDVATQADVWDYYLFDAGPGAGTINSVTESMYCKYVTSADHKTQFVMVTHSTNYSSGWVTLTTAYALYTKAYATNPFTGSAWTWAEIAAIQAGPRFYSSSSSGTLRCTQFYIAIDYTPPVIVVPTVTTDAASGLGLD